MPGSLPCSQTPFEVDRHALWLFTTCAFLMSPLTFLWLEGLESAFPGSYEEKPAPKSKTEKGKEQEQKPRSRLNVKNIVAKVVIDQTIGGAYNTFLLIALMGYLRGEDYGTIMEQVNNVGVALLLDRNCAITDLTPYVVRTSGPSCWRG